MTVTQPVTLSLRRILRMWCSHTVTQNRKLDSELHQWSLTYANKEETFPENKDGANCEVGGEVETYCLLFVHFRVA